MHSLVTLVLVAFTVAAQLTKSESSARSGCVWPGVACVFGCYLSSEIPRKPGQCELFPGEGG